MSKGDVVIAPDGEKVVLVDVGQEVLLDNDVVRVWDVALAPGEVQPWHLHHNPYLVLSLEAAPGRMDWLDGSEPRYLNEYRGGAVLRPTSPVHRLTNIGETHYRNRLVEFKDLGEHRGLDRPAADIGAGDRSVAGERPSPPEADGRNPVMSNRYVGVWEVTVPAGTSCVLELGDLPRVVAPIDAPPLGEDPAGGVRYHGGGPLRLANDSDREAEYFIAELRYLADLGPGGEVSID